VGALGRRRKDGAISARVLANTGAAELGHIDDVHVLEPDLEGTRAKLRTLERIVHERFSLGSPRTDMLLHLIQLNFTRALMENMSILGLLAEHLHDEALSPFNTAGPWLYDFEAHLPSSLRPTTVQRAVQHHPWLDLLPVAQLRDNLILAGESYDETQLCLDIQGHGSERTGNTGIIVWGESWDASGWEVTESFAGRWGWVIQGCSGLFQSTNQWRSQRDEGRLFELN
jgi:hypothetical protein